MKESDLTIRLTKNEKKRIDEFPVLLNVENVNEVSNSLGILRTEVNITAIKRRLCHEIVRDHSIEAVGSKTDTDEIVDNHEFSGIESLSLFHKLH